MFADLSMGLTQAFVDGKLTGLLLQALFVRISTLRTCFTGFNANGPETHHTIFLSLDDVPYGHIQTGESYLQFVNDVSVGNKPCDSVPDGMTGDCSLRPGEFFASYMKYFT